MRKKHTRRRIGSDYFRSVLFGCEDALVSTTGVVVGMSVGTENKAIIILAGFVTVAVEALSMGAGEYSSEKAVHQLEHDRHPDRAVKSAILMFVSYFLAGLIPLLPAVIFDKPFSTVAVLTAACIGLFVLGFVKGTVAHVSALRSAVEILVIGGLATLLGSVVGVLLKI